MLFRYGPLFFLCLFLASCGPVGTSSGLDGKNFFVTSQTFSGNLNGPAGADLKCQLAANQGGLAGVYKAWLSMTGENLLARINLTYPLRRATGLAIFQNDAERISGIILTAPNVDEYGFEVTTNLVWTNTDSSGFGEFNDCANWTSASAAVDGGYGDASVTQSQAWTSSGVTACSQLLRLYCIEQ